MLRPTGRRCILTKIQSYALDFMLENISRPRFLQNELRFSMYPRQCLGLMWQVLLCCPTPTPIYHIRNLFIEMTLFMQ